MKELLLPLALLMNDIAIGCILYILVIHMKEIKKIKNQLHFIKKEK